MINQKKTFLLFLIGTSLSTARCFCQQDNIITFFLGFAYLSFSLIAPGTAIYYFFKLQHKKATPGSVITSIAVLGTAWNSFVILLLACVFKFSLPVLLIINIILTAPIFFIPTKKISFTRPRKLDYLILIFLITAVFLFFRPMPRINGGRDPGVYFGTAMNIAKRGTLIFSEKSVPIFAEKYYSRNLLYNYETTNGTGMYLPGFYLLDHKQGKIAPQFFHLYSSFIALIFALMGMKLALYSTCFLALLSVMVIYYLLKIVFPGKTALFSIIIIIFSAHNVWYARYPNSEIIVQLLFFASILFFVQSDKLRQYLLSGLLLGLTFFARIDSLLLAGSLMGAGVLVSIKPKLIKSVGTTVITAFACFVTAQLYGYYFSKIYYLSKFLYLAQQKQNLILIITAGYTLVWIILYVIKNRISFNLFVKILSIILSAIIISFFIHSYFKGQNSPARWFIMYYSIYGVIAGLAGITLFLFFPKNQSDTKIAAKFFLLCSFFIWVTVLFPDPKIRPDHFWAIRRFTAVAMPVLAIGTGCLFDLIFFRSLRLFKIIGVIVYILFVFVLSRILYPTLKLSECDGLIDGLYSLKQHIRPNSAIILFDPKIGLYGTPLYFSNILDHSFFIPVGQNANLMKDFSGLEKILTGFINNKKDVYFFSFKPQHFPLKSLVEKPVVRIETPIPLVEIVTDRLPSKTEPIFNIKENFLYVWRLEKK